MSLDNRVALCEKTGGMQMRNLNMVIGQMLEHIPERSYLANHLRYIQKSIIYTAPEAQGVRWEQTATLLGDIIPPEEIWQLKVLSIFSTKSEEELRNIYVTKE